MNSLLSGLISSAEVCVDILSLPICLGGLLNGLLGGVLVPVVDILGQLVDSLLSPLLQALGISLAPSELTLESVGQSYTLIESGI